MAPDIDNDSLADAAAAVVYQSSSDLASVLRAAGQGLSQDGQMSLHAQEGFSPRRGFTYKRTEEAPKNDNDKYICKFQGSCAGLTFDRKCEWSKHMDKHERPYKCEAQGCEKLQGFTYSGGLLRHQREVHKMHGGTKESLYCPYPNCKRSSGSGFTRKENRGEHIRRVHRRTTEGSIDGLEPSSPAPSKRDASAMEQADALLRGGEVGGTEHEDEEQVEAIDPHISGPKRRRVANGSVVIHQSLPTNGLMPANGSADDLHSTVLTLKKHMELLIAQNESIRNDYSVLTQKVLRLEETISRQMAIGGEQMLGASR